MRCWTGYRDYIDQESLYLEYRFNRYDRKNKNAYFYRRLFPFADISEWKKLPAQTTNISSHYVVGEFIRSYHVKDSFSKYVDIAIPLTEIEDALELVDGYEWNLDRFPEVSNVDIPENKLALLIYIVLMLASCIFKEPYGLWLVFTIAYFGFTQTMTDRYGGEK